MKIAIDVTASIYEGTGVATYYNNLIPRLLKRAPHHEFILFGYSLRRQKDLKLANKTFPFPPGLMEIIWNRLHIIPVERLVGECDILHTWDYIQAPTRNAKVVTTIHDLTPLKFPKQQHSRTIKAYKQGLKWVKKSASAIIADSLSTKQDIIDLLKIPKNKIFTVYLAAPDHFHDFCKLNHKDQEVHMKQVKSKYSIENKYLLFVGTQEPRKNLERVINAFKTLNSQFQLIIAGNVGWGKRIKPAENVKTIGFVSDQDLPALFAGASCFIYPSLYEGFGLPVIEAMAVGCPVVTSDRGSLAEISGDAAVLVNPESVEAILFGIESALNNSQSLSEKGKQRAKEFSWDMTAEYTLAVYERIGQQRSSMVKKQ